MSTWEHPRGFDVSPDDAVFDDLHSPTTGKGEQLDVKSKTIQTLNRRQCARSFTREELEAALGIVDSRQNESANEEVEAATHEIAIAWLWCLNERAVDGAGTDDHRVSETEFGHCPHLFDRGCEISVAKQNQRSRGVAETGANGSALAPVLWMAQGLEGYLGGERNRTRMCKCIVRRPIIDDNDLSR